MNTRAADEPAELSGLRVLWLVLTRHPTWLVHNGVKALFGPAVIVLSGGAVLWLTAGLHVPAAMLLVVGAFAVCLVALVLNTVARWPSRRNPVLDLERHPELRELVVEVSRLVGLPKVAKVRLDAWAPALGLPRANVLYLGVPLLTELDRDELRAMIAWDLLMGRRPWHERYVQELAFELPALAEHGHRLRREHLRATSELVGLDAIERSRRRRARVIGAFEWYVARYVDPLADDAGDGYAADIHEAFRWKVREDRLLERIRPPESSDRIDPELLSGWEADLPPVVERVVDALPRELEHRLARFVAQDLLRGRSLAVGAPRHLLFELSADTWLPYQQAVRSSVLAAAEKVLGRPATGRDVVDLVVAGRAGELDLEHERPCVHPTRGVCALLPLLDVALRGWGYTYAHPLRQRELTGPSGDVIDMVELAGKIERGAPYGFDLTGGGGSLTERDPDADARRLAAESLAGDDPTGWFERLYAEAASGEAIVPWDSQVAHPLLVEWAKDLDGRGRRAMVVGCGLGDDAEHVASLGYETVAFDVSLSAVRGARERFPESKVYYQSADLFDTPGEWHRAFDLVVEIMTVQALPEALHEQATAAVRDLVAPGGTLLVIASAREEGGPVAAPPWQLTPDEIDAFGADGLTAERIEDLREPERRRWRASFRRT